MKNIYIKYNPYLLQTDITIDGKELEANSSLHFDTQCLQEWAKKFVKILLEEYCDTNVTIEFTGSLVDFNDFKEIIESSSDKIHITKWTHNCKPEVEEVEKEVINLFNDIQNGPIEALKEQAVIDAFEKAMDAQFNIYIIASMAAGKTTLINALLGKKLMPMAQMATTTTITRIFASDQPNYSAVAKDNKGTIVAREDDITYESMKAWDRDEHISSIDICGPIPFAKNAGMRIVLIDTPTLGFGNSMDQSHKKMIYKMLEPSDNSLVLYVHSFGGGYDDGLIDYIGECIYQDDKKTYDRYLFAVTKMDTYDPETDSVAEVLAAVKKTLDKRGIEEPNLFPVAALPCLQIRDKEIKKRELRHYESLIEESDEFKFDKYYQLNHLPVSSRIRLESSNDEYTKTELHTGIPSIEEAIRLYVNKYARTMKVRDLVDSFNQHLVSHKAVVEFEKRFIENNIDRLIAKIATLEDLINSGQFAEIYFQLIDNVDIPEIIRSVSIKLNSFLRRIDKLTGRYDDKTKVTKYDAERAVEDLESIRGDLHSIYNDCLKMAFEHIINRFKTMYSNLFSEIIDNGFYNPMDSLNEVLLSLEKILLNTISAGYDDFKTNDKGFAYNVIQNERLNIDHIISNATYCVDEGCMEHRKVKVEVKVKRSIGDPLYWLGSMWKMEEKEETISTWVPKYVEYVNMVDVVENYFIPLCDEIVNIRNHIAQDAERLKEKLKGQIKEIEKILTIRLKDVREHVSNAEHIREVIMQKEYELRWMNSISERVNNLTNY